ncbi:MAG: Gldg family protein, partial [Chitinophagaceae bacterium]|nr:Gldg family protein [Chitinophagaceae bacterium]
MKKIIRIARVEVLSLFYMPVAWLILIAFIIQTGTDFFTEAYRYGVGNSLGYLVHDFITYHLFYDRYVGLFTLLKTKLIYYIPLLTMGVISKEISSGSIKLLLSSPVKISEFVLGKFFGVAIFNLFFIAVLMIYGIISLFVVENMDWPAVLSGLLGIYLLICTYAAVGVFVSSLTSYQAVAALLTLAILFSMNNISIVWQNYDFFRDLTYNLSLSGRIEVFISGLITTRDVIYYLMMITAFLGLTMMRLSFNRQMMPFSARLPRYALLILAVAGIGYISGRPKLIGYWDVTANQGQSLSPQGQEIMKKFKQPVEVTTYVNLLEENYNRFKPQIRNGDLLNLEPYRRFHRDMEFNYVNYYDTTPRSWQINANYGMSIPDIAKKVAKAEGKSLDYYLSPKEIRKKIDLSSVENRIIREFKMGNRRATIMGTFLGELPEEKEMLVPFKMLLGSEPKVLGFVQGHNERELDAPRGLKMLTSDIEGKKSLCNNG